MNTQSSSKYPFIVAHKAKKAMNMSINHPTNRPTHPPKSGMSRGEACAIPRRIPMRSLSGDGTAMATIRPKSFRAVSGLFQSTNSNANAVATADSKTPLNRSFAFRRGHSQQNLMIKEHLDHCTSSHSLLSSPGVSSSRESPPKGTSCNQRLPPSTRIRQKSFRAVSGLFQSTNNIDNAAATAHCKTPLNRSFSFRRGRSQHNLMSEEHLDHSASSHSLLGSTAASSSRESPTIGTIRDQKKTHSTRQHQRHRRLPKQSASSSAKSTMGELEEFAKELERMARALEKVEDGRRILLRHMKQ
jgi:hypothetical protein